MVLGRKIFTYWKDHTLSMGFETEFLRERVGMGDCRNRGEYVKGMCSVWKEWK